MRVFPMKQSHTHVAYRRQTRNNTEYSLAVTVPGSSRKQDIRNCRSTCVRMLNVVGSIYLFFFVRVLDDGDFFFGYRSRSVGRSVDRPVSVSRSVGCFTAISKRGGSQLFFIAVNIRNAQLFLSPSILEMPNCFYRRQYQKCPIVFYRRQYQKCPIVFYRRQYQKCPIVFLSCVAFPLFSRKNPSAKCSDHLGIHTSYLFINSTR